MVFRKLRHTSPLVIGAIVLLALGAFLSILPVASYYFGTYTELPYHNEFSIGSNFVFYGEYGAFFQPNGSVFTYGMILNYRYLGGSSFSLDGSLYELTGNPVGLNLQLLPNNPFIAQNQYLVTKTDENLTYDENQSLQLLFPSSNHVEARFASFPITNSTYFSSAPSYLGFAKFYSASPGGYNMSSYVTIGGRYVMFGYASSSNMEEFMQQVFPSIMYSNQSNTQFELYLGGGNSVPDQDWGQAFSYSFGIAFPVNIIMFLIAAILVIIKVRRVR